MISSQNGHFEVINFLLKRLVPIQENDALMISSENRDSEVVNLLLKHGCNLEHQANDSITTHDSRHFYDAEVLLKAYIY